MKNPYVSPEAVGDMEPVFGWLERVQELSATDQITHEEKFQSESSQEARLSGPLLRRKFSLSAGEFGPNRIDISSDARSLIKIPRAEFSNL
jgi:hypothetical protein